MLEVGKLAVAISQSEKFQAKPQTMDSINIKDKKC